MAYLFALVDCGYWGVLRKRVRIPIPYAHTSEANTGILPSKAYGSTIGTPSQGAVCSLAVPHEI